MPDWQQNAYCAKNIRYDDSKNWLAFCNRGKNFEEEMCATTNKMKNTQKIMIYSM